VVGQCVIAAADYLALISVTHAQQLYESTLPLPFRLGVVVGSHPVMPPTTLLMARHATLRIQSTPVAFE
jgi:hypothetical protein